MINGHIIGAIERYLTEEEQKDLEERLLGERSHIKYRYVALNEKLGRSMGEMQAVGFDRQG